MIVTLFVNVTAADAAVNPPLPLRVARRFGRSAVNPPPLQETHVMAVTLPVEARSVTVIVDPWLKAPPSAPFPFTNPQLPPWAAAPAATVTGTENAGNKGICVPSCRLSEVGLTSATSKVKSEPNKPEVPAILHTFRTVGLKRKFANSIPVVAVPAITAALET